MLSVTWAFGPPIEIKDGPFMSSFGNRPLLKPTGGFERGLPLCGAQRCFMNFWKPAIWAWSAGVRAVCVPPRLAGLNTSGVGALAVYSHLQRNAAEERRKRAPLRYPVYNIGSFPGNPLLAIVYSSTGFYYRLAGSAIRHRWLVFSLSLLFLVVGAVVARALKSSFFPDDVQYWSYLDIWLPNDASFTATKQATQAAEQVVRQVSEQYGREHPGKDGQPRQILKSITSFVGSGGPRFWSSVSPQQQQRNYAQVIIETTEKEVTPPLVLSLQSTLSRTVPGARIDARVNSRPTRSTCPFK